MYSYGYEKGVEWPMVEGKESNFNPGGKNACTQGLHNDYIVIF